MCDVRVPKDGYALLGADRPRGRGRNGIGIRMNLPEQLGEGWPPAEWSEVGVLIAVSGGPDSVALLRAMADLKQRVGGAGWLVVGHFNHQLRPEADGDAEFVADLAGQLGLRFEQGRGEVRELSKLRGDGVEAAAREARYEFLLRAAEKCGARYVVTGHTADDQAETVLFNFLRGTGLAGLAGIQRVRPLNSAVSLMRPMLGVRRTDVIGVFAIDRAGVSNGCDEFGFGIYAESVAK